MNKLEQLWCEANQLSEWAPRLDGSDVTLFTRAASLIARYAGS